MGVETIARRYATALADVVLKAGDAETVKAELKIWEQLLTASNDLERAFSNPSIAQSKKERVLEGLIGKTRPSGTTANFLRVLVRNGRLMILSHVMARFDSVLEERSGIVSAEVASARELSDAQRTELKINLEKQTGKRVKLSFAVDTSLIGGVVTRIGSTVFDGSVKTHLENLKEELIGS